MDAPNGTSHVPPEIEATLSRLSAYRNVRGVMILARGSSGAGIVQSTGAVFEGESGRRYAGALEGVVAATAGAVGSVDEGVSWRCDGE
jgi:dynein light chain roadblock-type